MPVCKFAYSLNGGAHEHIAILDDVHIVAESRYRSLGNGLYLNLSKLVRKYVRSASDENLLTTNLQCVSSPCFLYEVLIFV